MNAFGINYYEKAAAKRIAMNAFGINYYVKEAQKTS
jgi:hypothetical protein